jgi:type I restriction enzyme, S subunit
MGSTLLQQFTIRQINDISIPLPPLPEQQRIVAILDEAFAAIAKAKANAEQNLKNAKELFESYLQSVFENKGEGWEKKTLGEVCEFTQGIQRDVKLQSEEQKQNQVRFLRIVDFTQGNEPPRYIENPGEKYILNQDDVSLVRYGASTGFVCRGLEGALANNLFRVIPKAKKEITNDFLFAYLTSPIFQNVIKTSMNGAAMPAISFGLIKDIPFPIISVNEQQTIVQKLDALSAQTKKLEAIYQQQLNDLDELKKSILQKAFNGELKQNNPEGMP